jgi:hypothetical protein
MTLIVLPLFLLLFASVVLSMYYGTKATLNRKPGVPYFPGGGERPGNVLFRPTQLTDKGLKARKLSFKYTLIALSTMALIGLLSIVWSVIHRNP